MTPQKALKVLFEAATAKSRQLSFQARLFRRGILINGQTERAAKELDEIWLAYRTLEEIIDA